MCCLLVAFVPVRFYGSDTFIPQVTLKVLGCLHVGFLHRLMGAFTHCGFQAEVRYAPVSWRLVRRPPAIAAVCRTAN